jgi:hypothetical protein
MTPQANPNVIAYCEKCGRGFLFVRKGIVRDPYARLGSDEKEACGGWIERLKVPAPNDRTDFRPIAKLRPPARADKEKT